MKPSEINNLVMLLTGARSQRAAAAKFANDMMLSESTVKHHMRGDTMPDRTGHRFYQALEIGGSRLYEALRKKMSS